MRNLKHFLLLATLCGGAFTARAIDDTPENRNQQADRYLVAAPVGELVREMAKGLSGTMPDAQEDKFLAVFSKSIDYDALSKGMKTAMVKIFTASELSALADFYASPDGKSAMKKFGPYMAEVMPTLQAEVQKALAKAMAEEKPAAP